MTKTFPYIVIALLLLYIGFQCNGKKDANDIQLQAWKDSTHAVVTAKRAADTAYMAIATEYRAYRAAATDSIAKLTAFKDAANSQLHATNTRIRNLIDETRDMATRTNDTALLARIANAEALYNQKNELIAYMEATGDRKDSIYAAEIASCDIASDRKDSMYTSLSKLFERLATLQEATLAKAQKLSIAERKRFVIGPSIGAGIGSTGKVTPVVGISVSYRLIRF